jgi:hypothetical protein
MSRPRNPVQNDHLEVSALPDVLNYLGQALTILGLWLNHVTSPIPWPLFLAFLFLPVVAVFRTALWFLRGTTWPVMCKYYHTQQRRRDKPCRTPVPGEWYYCRHHRKHKIMSDGHRCDPSLQRWQARDRRSGRIFERSDIRGVGLVQLFSNRETLLFYKGLPRRPRDVVPGILPGELKRRWQREFSRLREVRLKDIFRDTEAAPQGVSSRMPRVVIATRFVLISYAIGLLTVGISVFVNGTSQVIEQYYATVAFILAWNGFRFGVLKDKEAEPRWMRTTLFDSSKAIGVLIVLAIVGNILQSAHTSVQVR